MANPTKSSEDRITRMEQFFAKDLNKQMFKGGEFNPKGHKYVVNRLDSAQRAINEISHSLTSDDMEIIERLRALQEIVNNEKEKARQIEAEHLTPPPLPPRPEVKAEAPPPLPPRPEVKAEAPPPLPPRPEVKAEAPPPLPPRPEVKAEAPPPLPPRPEVKAEAPPPPPPRPEVITEVNSAQDKKGVLGSFKGLFSKFKSDKKEGMSPRGQHQHGSDIGIRVKTEGELKHENAIVQRLDTLSVKKAQHTEATKTINVLLTEGSSSEGCFQNQKLSEKSGRLLGMTLNEVVDTEISYNYMLRVMDTALDELALEKPNQREKILACKGNVGELIKNSDVFIKQLSDIKNENDIAKQLQIYMKANNPKTLGPMLDQMEVATQKQASLDINFTKIELGAPSDEKFTSKFQEVLMRVGPGVAEKMRAEGLNVDSNTVAQTTNQTNFGAFTILAVQRAPRYQLLARDIMAKCDIDVPNTKQKSSALSTTTENHMQVISDLITARNGITNANQALKEQTQAAIPEVEREYKETRKHSYRSGM